MWLISLSKINYIIVNMIYDKPFYYVMIHIIIGMISYQNMYYGILFIIYQLSQLYLQKRFFLMEWTIKEGNSVEHTLVKLGEWAIGWIVAFLLHQYCFNDRFISLS
jgi:hypothetical protein